MTSTTTTAPDYEAMTVAELKEELAARGLHTSGLKEELITRLEEDDTARAAGESDEEAAAEVNAEDEPDYYPPTIYSPYELPANTAAAQLFFDTNPGAVDPNLVLDDMRQEQALAHIQAHVDEMAAVGVVIEDPRLGDGGTAPPDPEIPPTPAQVTGIDPTSGSADTDIALTITGVGLAGTTDVATGTATVTNLTASDTEVTCTLNSSTPSTDPVVLTVDGATVTGPDFTFTAPELQTP